MQSDNGTNFIGAVKEINHGIKNLKRDKITTYINIKLNGSLIVP